MNSTQPLIRRDVLFRVRRFNNYCFESILLIGGLIFFIVGVSSWTQKNIIPFIANEEIQFLPQGLAICFYGAIFFIAGIYLSWVGFFAVGSGFNEYNKVKKYVRIFRWGFPGQR